MKKNIAGKNWRKKISPLEWTIRMAYVAKKRWDKVSTADRKKWSAEMNKKRWKLSTDKHLRNKK